MDGLLGIAVVAFLIIGACIQVAISIHHRYTRSHRDAEKDRDDLAAAVELQLHSELNDAIKSSSTAYYETNEKLDDYPPPYSHASVTPRVHFSDTKDDIASWNNFKQDGRAKLRRLAKAITFKPNVTERPFDHVSDAYSNTSPGGIEPTGGTSGRQPSSIHPVLPLPALDSSPEEKKAILVNAKQYNRILKRRLTRKLIEEYFRSRPPVKNASLRNDGVYVTMRRPRGPTGRFLTDEEFKQTKMAAQTNGHM